MRKQTYARAGVDPRKVRRLHSILAVKIASTHSLRSEGEGNPLLPIGHYAGLIDIGGTRALALHTDGVGSKVLIAQKMKKFDTVGVDCVAMTVNDLICLGAEPVALLDYVALEKENDRLVSELAKGLVRGAKLSKTPIVGGETAILGDIVRGENGEGFDLVSMGVGLVEKSAVLDGRAVEAGDVVLGVESSGLHSNGYTLARMIIGDTPLHRRVQELDTTLGEALLAPTYVYVEPALRAIKTLEVHGLAHITGGSFAKLSRLAGSRRLAFDLTLPEAPPIFGLLQRMGGVSDREMMSTFNMGIGLCVIMPAGDAGRASRLFGRYGFATYDLGSVKTGSGVVVNGERLG